jgi:uncharacterized membrane protein YgcG
MRNHLTTRHSLAAIVGLVASCVILGAGAGCAQDPGPDANVSPVTRSSEASSVTADATGIQTFNVATETGALTISGHDLGGSPVAKFRVTKAPLVKHAGAVLPVIVVEETGADGSSMHAESASVYPNQTDLARTEFELYGVGNANLIVRSAFDASGTLARLSLFAYHGDSAPGETRLGKFLSSQIQSAKPFDVPSSYASIDDFIEAWVDTHGLAPVFDSKQLDRVYFTMKDPSWLAAVVDAIEPGTMASTDGNAATASDEGLTLQNQGGTGSGSSGSGSNGSGSKGSGSGSGGKSGSSGSGGSKGGSKQPGKVSGCDKGGLGGFLGGVLGNVAKNPIGAVSGAKACKKCADDLTGKSKKPVGTKTAARSTKPSGAKSALASSAKVVKTPKKTSTSSSACTTCQKFMKTTGVTKGATCLLGKVTNGLFGSSKGGASQNSKGNSPADDMSDECSSGGASCDAAPEGDSCTMGDDSCDFDPGQNANDSGSFDLGGDDGGDFDMFDADE